MKQVISPKNLPARLPIVSTTLAILALDYWSAPQWMCGAIGVLFLLIWISVIYGLYNQKVVDLFESEEEREKTSGFEDRLARALEERRKIEKRKTN